MNEAARRKLHLRLYTHFSYGKSFQVLYMSPEDFPYSTRRRKRYFARSSSARGLDQLLNRWP